MLRNITGTIISEEDQEQLSLVLNTILQRAGVDLRNYKQTTIRRRVWRRTLILGFKSIPDYVQYFRSNEQEQHLLFREMLIHVSSFFRDETSFEHLCNRILPAIFSERPSDETIRVWVCGCATGEEAYSIAMCLHEQAELTGNLSRIKIFATDLSESVIARARRGVYSESSLRNVSPQRLQRYFTQHREGSKIKSFIREMCVFAVHNVVSDPPFANLDLLSCRNLLIYMQPVLQKKALATFSYALKENGYLFLGKSETSGASDRFEISDKDANIYLNRYKTGSRSMADSPEKKNPVRGLQSRISQYKMERKDFQNAADELLLQKYVPSGVVVNEHFDIVDFRGATGFFIEPSPGIASLNVLKMVRKGLYFDLDEALARSRSERIPVTRENIALEHDGKLLRITLEVIPLVNVREKHYLVLFHTVNVVDSSAAFAEDGIPDTRDLRILQLEQELLQSREQIRAVGEEQEATNEEFQSANEELKTLNEELQTSQEEVIFINEELILRNKELGTAIEELRVAKKLADSINNTVSDALVVLDKELRIKVANTSFYEKFEILPNDTEHKLIYTIGNGQWNIPELRSLLEEVLPKKNMFRDLIITHTFEHLGERVMKFSGRQIKGDAGGEAFILLAINDITDVSRAAEQLLEKQQIIAINEERQRLAIDAAQYGIWDYEIGSDTLFLSKEARKILSTDKVSLAGWKPLLDNVFQEDVLRVSDSMQSAIDGGYSGFFAEEYRIILPEKQGMRWVSNQGKAIFDENSEVKRFTGVVSDITERKEADTRLNETMVRLDLAMKAGHIGSWELDLQTRELYTSTQCKANFGLPGTAEMTYDTLLNAIIEDDRARMQQTVGEALASRTPYYCQYRITWPDNAIRWIEASGIIQSDTSGEPIRLVGVTIDITEQKEVNQKLAYSEHHFKTLADSSPVMVAMCNEDGTFYFLNKQWQKFVGTTDAGTASYAWGQFMHPDDWADFEKMQVRSMQNHSRFSQDVRLMVMGKYRWVTCIAEPRFGINHRFAGYTMACVDIHDQKTANEELERIVEERTGELRHLNDDLLDRNNELRQFAYVTSHDLQEPLRKIKIFANMLLAKDSVEATYLTETLNKIQHSASRMIGLIRDLLNYSSLQDKTHSFSKVDLDAIAKDVLIDFDLLMQEKQAQIVLEDLPIIDAIPLQMNQLFYNLIGNALKFSKEDVKPVIMIKSTSLTSDLTERSGLEKGKAYCKISFSDNGIGFNPEYKERIFEIFQRLHNREAYGGNGIGLALCRRIATNHNGIIIPHSEEGAGAVFDVILPLRQLDL